MYELQRTSSSPQVRRAKSIGFRWFIDFQQFQNILSLRLYESFSTRSIPKYLSRQIPSAADEILSRLDKISTTAQW
jgi:hypothetical protein